MISWANIISGLGTVADLIGRIYVASQQQALSSAQPQIQAYATSKLNHLKNLQQEIETKRAQLQALTSNTGAQVDFTRMALYVVGGLLIGVVIGKVVKR